MENNLQPQVPNPSKPRWFAYGSRPLWQWVIIYVTIIAIIGGLIYFFTNLSSFTSHNDSRDHRNDTMVAITISRAGFSPEKVTIRKGATVTWTNTDEALHTITADSDGPVSPELQKNSTYSDTFITTGKYSYHCSLHPTMKGEIEVVE